MSQLRKDDEQSYTISPGDSMAKIAKTFYGDSSMYMRLSTFNQLKNAGAIAVGQILRIPSMLDLLRYGQETQDAYINLAAKDLQNIFPSISDELAHQYSDSLNRFCPQFDVCGAKRQAHFLAQIGHESNQLRNTEENLNYSAERLLVVFGKYFDEASASAYERQPEAIASIAYANRIGNGDVDSKDGWHFRGRGLIQLTGRDNYASCSKAINADLLANPDQVAHDPDIAVASALWFWLKNDLNTLSDSGTVEDVSRKVNGGTLGLEERKHFYDAALSHLANS